MSGNNVLVAALLAMTMGAAHADSVSFNYEGTAEDLSAWNFKSVTSPDSSVMTTNGLQTATAGPVSASVNGWANPTTGMFKSYASVNINGDKQINIGSASVALNVSDTLHFTGTGSTVSVTFSLNYDTTFSGLSMTPFDRVNQIDHFMSATSDRSLNLSYSAANPNYDSGCIPGIEMPCAGPTTTISEYAGKTLFKQIALSGPTGGSTISYGDAGNGNFNGVVTLTAILPTNTDITLNYSASNSLMCFHLGSCGLTASSLNSEYIGLTVQGGTFTSSSGFQYLGLAAAVPEPESYAMLLAGLGLIGGIARRRSRHSR